MLTLLTATGARPQAWALCERWMARQTYAGAVRWVIVDDGPEAQPVRFSREGWTLEVIRPEPAWQPGQNTQARNLAAGLRQIGDQERVAVIEDDDWYATDWLEAVDAALDRHALVGEGLARYYNVRTGVHRQLRNNKHASLCSTAMRGLALRRFRSVCASRPKFIDIVLWAAGGGHLMPGHRVVGLKGLSGRGGIGMGHAAAFSGNVDADGSALRAWIGEDAEAYR